MAFTGTLVNTVIGKNTTLIKGASLPGGGAGSIGNYGDSGADHELPEAAPALDEDTTEVQIHEIAQGALLPLSWVISGTPKRLTIKNGANVSGELRIRIKSEHSLTK